MMYPLHPQRQYQTMPPARTPSPVVRAWYKIPATNLPHLATPNQTLHLPQKNLLLHHPLETHPLHILQIPFNPHRRLSPAPQFATLSPQHRLISQHPRQSLKKFSPKKSPQKTRTTVMYKTKVTRMRRVPCARARRALQNDYSQNMVGPRGLALVQMDQALQNLCRSKLRSARNGPIPKEEALLRLLDGVPSLVGKGRGVRIRGNLVP